MYLSQPPFWKCNHHLQRQLSVKVIAECVQRRVTSGNKNLANEDPQSNDDLGKCGQSAARCSGPAVTIGRRSIATFSSSVSRLWLHFKSSEQSLQGSYWVGFNNCLVWGWFAPKWAWKSTLWCFSNVFNNGLTKCSFFRCAWFSQQDVGHCWDEPSSVALPGNDFLHLIKHCARLIIKHNSCSCSRWLLADS